MHYWTVEKGPMYPKVVSGSQPTPRWWPQTQVQSQLEVHKENKQQQHVIHENMTWAEWPPDLNPIEKDWRWTENHSKVKANYMYQHL